MNVLSLVATYPLEIAMSGFIFSLAFLGFALSFQPRQIRDPNSLTSAERNALPKNYGGSSTSNQSDYYVSPKISVEVSTRSVNAMGKPAGDNEVVCTGCSGISLTRTWNRQDETNQYLDKQLPATKGIDYDQYKEVSPLRLDDAPIEVGISVGSIFDSIGNSLASIFKG